MLEKSWFIIGATFDITGKILIGFTVLLVHKALMKEHRIDKRVVKGMKREQVLGGLGIIFMIVGYLIHVAIL